MELAKTYEAAKDTAANLAHFVVERLTGGAWAKLADIVTSEQAPEQPDCKKLN